MSNDQERRALVERASEEYEKYTGAPPETTEFAYIQAGARDMVENREK